MIAGQLALLNASMYTSGAFYVTAIEHPTFLELDDRNLLKAFHGMYPRAKKLMSIYGLVGASAGIYQYFETKDPLWLIGSGFLFANIPYWILALVPTNNKLMETPVSRADSETRKLIEKWGPLHNVRTMFGAVSTAVFFYAVLKHQKLI